MWVCLSIPSSRHAVCSSFRWCVFMRFLSGRLYLEFRFDDCFYLHKSICSYLSWILFEKFWLIITSENCWSWRPIKWLIYTILTSSLMYGFPQAFVGFVFVQQVLILTPFFMFNTMLLFFTFLRYYHHQHHCSELSVLVI